MKMSGTLDSTVVILSSPEGLNRGKHFGIFFFFFFSKRSRLWSFPSLLLTWIESLQGQVDHKLPLLYTIAPDAFVVDTLRMLLFSFSPVFVPHVPAFFPFLLSILTVAFLWLAGDTLHNNEKALISGRDVYEGIRGLLRKTIAFNGIFAPINQQRTCAQAYIPGNFSTMFSPLSSSPPSLPPCCFFFRARSHWVCRRIMCLLSRKHGYDLTRQSLPFRSRPRDARGASVTKDKRKWMCRCQ